MTAHDRDRFSRLLQEKEQSLLELLRQRDTITIEKAADEVDALQLAQGREVAIETLHRISWLLQSVRAARDRLADGSFGICLRCDEKISLKRLNAVPWAAYCVACQSIVDQETSRSLRDGLAAVESFEES
jgi:DnaK suppressor protein